MKMLEGRWLWRGTFEIWWTFDIGAKKQSAINCNVPLNQILMRIKRQSKSLKQLNLRGPKQQRCLTNRNMLVLHKIVRTVRYTVLTPRIPRQLL
jgi:hypothetical protein